MAISDRALDDILEGITFIISREPQAGRLTDVEGILALPVDRTGTTPELVIYYAYINTDEVMLLSLVRATADPEFDLR